MGRRTTVMGWTLLGVVACANGGDEQSTDSASTAEASASGALVPSTEPPVAAPSTAATATPPVVTAGISAATGVFTVAQATRGHAIYTTACARCHMTTQHSGATFAASWNNRRVFDLYDILYNTMPLDDPGSLSEQDYIDVVAYILQLNGHPAGKTALPPDPEALKKLRIDIRKATGQ